MKKGLQKLTDARPKIRALLELEKITFQDIKSLTEGERDQLMAYLTERINKLKGEEWDEFYAKIEAIVDPSTKNHIWESNHSKITWAISTLMQEFGRLPSRREVAEKTGLSRQSVYNHLRDYANHPLYLEQNEQFRLLVPKVLSRVYQYALKGDIKAARLFFEVVGNLNNSKPNKTSIQNQNNFIQINGMVLNQEIIMQLTPGQLNEIEDFFKEVLSKPVSKNET
jgi:hypothetical protein